jgi:hypothetical protein
VLRANIDQLRQAARAATGGRITETGSTERVIDVADIELRFRHSIIGQLFKHLEPGNSLQIVFDHDP